MPPKKTHAGWLGVGWAPEGHHTAATFLRQKPAGRTSCDAPARQREKEPPHVRACDSRCTWGEVRYRHRLQQGLATTGGWSVERDRAGSKRSLAAGARERPGRAEPF